MSLPSLACPTTEVSTDTNSSSRARVSTWPVSRYAVGFMGCSLVGSGGSVGVGDGEGGGGGDEGGGGGDGSGEGCGGGDGGEGISNGCVGGGGPGGTGGEDGGKVGAGERPGSGIPPLSYVARAGLAMYSGPYSKW